MSEFSQNLLQLFVPQLDYQNLLNFNYVLFAAPALFGKTSRSESDKN